MKSEGGAKCAALAGLLAFELFAVGCCTSANSMAEPRRLERDAMWRGLQLPQPGMLQVYLRDWGPPPGGWYPDGNGGSILVYFSTFTCNRSGSYNSYRIGSATVGMYTSPRADCVAVRELLYFTSDGALYHVKVDKVGC